MTSFSKIKTLPTIFIVLLSSVLILLINHANLVVCGDLGDDSLENALEAIERSERALQSQEHFGQPENIGYGFQKNFGFFDPTGPAARHIGLRDPYDNSVFHEKPRPNQKEDYLQLIANIWNKYQSEHSAYSDVEDLSDDQIAAILGNLRKQDDLPRDQRNYRVFDKRLPLWRRNVNNQRLDVSPDDSTDPFLYSLKWVNPALNRESVEMLPPTVDDVAVDDRDLDLRNDDWLAQDDEDFFERKRVLPTRIFRQHNGVHLNRKRIPVKRNGGGARVRKQTNEQEVKDIFAKKSKVKEDGKKKKKDDKKIEGKKVVRRSEPVIKDAQINELFHVSKKNTDWSKYFGVDKRAMMYENPFDTRVFNTKRKYEDVDKSLDAMESKLSAAEEKLIEDTIRFVGAHTTDSNPPDDLIDEIRQRLGAAYSVEKIKHALEEFRRSVGVGAATESASTAPETTTAAVGSTSTVGVATTEGWKVLEEKRGRTDDNEECELLNRLMLNCVRVDEVLGPYSELLTPSCTLHQICYTCGPEIGVKHRNICDLMYLNEANHLCQGQLDCIASAKEAVMVLRGFHIDQPNGICHENPCIADHFLDSPSGVVPLK